MFNPNRVRIEFAYFVVQPDGTLICTAHDQDGNNYTYIIYSEGSVKKRKNQGIWFELSRLDAAYIRYVAGRFYKRLTEHEPTIFRTNHILA